MKIKIPAIIGCLLALSITNVRAELSDYLPDMPKVEIPKVEIPNGDGITSAALAMFSAFSSEVETAQPMLLRLGFEIETIKMELPPPSGKLRLTSRLSTPESQFGAADIPGESSLLVKSIVRTAILAKSVQDLLKLELVVIDVKMGTSPTIDVSYVKNWRTDQYRYS